MSAQNLTIDWRRGNDPEALRNREWLVTNGLGGYASGTLLGTGSRRYHGLFVPNLPDPKGRYILLSRFDEQVTCGDIAAHLGGAEFASGHLETETHLYLDRFYLDRSIPTWIFAIGDALVEKTIVMPHHQNTVCVNYRLLKGSGVQLKLRPFAAFRRQDDVLGKHSERPFVLSITHHRHELRLNDCPLYMRFRLRPDASFVSDEQESLDVFYRVEHDRGYDHSENAFSPGYFSIKLQHDRPVTFVASTQQWDMLEGINTDSVLEAERMRIDRLLHIAPENTRQGFPARLVTAADQFIVLPGSRLEERMFAEASGDEVRTVIAGYHWFSDWGRDTMISLEGLTLCTGRYREAGSILRTFSQYVEGGLLPNLFPEGERKALYHTVDATLWYFHAINRYQHIVGDTDIIRTLYPVLQSIVEHHVRGTHFGIGVDPHDGLLQAGAAGYQLTWMDAKVDDWVVTPRRGKPVEIQALWYNALCLMMKWGKLIGVPVGQYGELAEQARETFNARYWNEDAGHLFDVVDGENGNDASCRPNQLFSISLPYPILAESRWPTVIDRVQAELLTPYGLRTLNRSHPDYKPNYHGDLRTRDAAYHQGTVWPWLIGHFIDAWLKVHPDPSGARAMLDAFADHMKDMGIGSISEIFDAEPPYMPRGCIAQAWSVAEVLRAWLKTEGRVDTHQLAHG